MTIQDIAQKMNVSIATASKALNGSSDIAEDTRRQIREYAAQVGYRSRKSLSCNGRLALLWGKEIQSGDFGALAKIAEAFCKTAQQERYEVVVKTMAEEGFRLNDYLADHHFYGAFLLDLNFFSPVYAQLKKTRYPLVLLDNYLTDNERISGIGSENILSTECAVDYLVSLGHKKIAFLDGERQSLVSAERLAGYILGLSKNSIEYRCELTYFGDFSRRAGSDAAEYFHCKDFTAAVCASDLMAAGLIDRGYFRRRLRRSGSFPSSSLQAHHSASGFRSNRRKSVPHFRKHDKGATLSTLRSRLHLTSARHDAKTRRSVLRSVC